MTNSSYTATSKFHGYGRITYEEYSSLPLMPVFLETTISKMTEEALKGLHFTLKTPGEASQLMKVIPITPSKVTPRLRYR
ncbi:hypothetical protein FRB95_012779 [Tulasnella sp. JGI-2019a]|nr:hypothetical protein FRB95_012779 [Tulasnella sp. JGI-2019a]